MRKYKKYQQTWQVLEACRVFTDYDCQSFKALAPETLIFASSNQLIPAYDTVFIGYIFYRYPIAFYEVTQLPVLAGDTMKTGHEGLIFSVLSMLTLGVSNYLYKRSVEFLGPTNTTFFYYMFSSVLAIIVWVLFREKERVTAGSLIWPAMLAVFLFVSVWTFNYAVQFIDISVASTIRSLCFVVTIFLAIALSQEQLSIKDWIAVVLAIVAIVLFGIKDNSFK